MASRRAQKDQKKAERLAQEARLRDEQRRRRRLQIIGGASGLLVVVAATLLIVSSSGKDQGTGLKGVNQVNRSLTGIAQEGDSLGSPKAPVTIVEFADLQCPFCRDFSNQILPPIVEKYVKTGKLRMELRFLTFLGPDSELASRYALFAGQQGRLWNFAEIFYQNQGAEGSGYVTKEFLDNVSKAAGVTPLPTQADLSEAEIKKQLEEATVESQKAGINSTPSFLIGKTGGKLRKLEDPNYNLQTFEANIESLLK